MEISFYSESLARTIQIFERACHFGRSNQNQRIKEVWQQVFCIKANVQQEQQVILEKYLNLTRQQFNLSIDNILEQLENNKQISMYESLHRTITNGLLVSKFENSWNTIDNCFSENNLTLLHYHSNEAPLTKENIDKLHTKTKKITTYLQIFLDKLNEIENIPAELKNRISRDINNIKEELSAIAFFGTYPITNNLIITHKNLKLFELRNQGNKSLVKLKDCYSQITASAKELQMLEYLFEKAGNALDYVKPLFLE